MTKIKIEMAKVLHYSKNKISFGGDSGKLMIVRNLDCMKKWTEEEIDEIFDDEGNFIWELYNLEKRGARSKHSVSGAKRLSLTSNDPGARADLIRSTRKEVVAALKKIFADEKLEKSTLLMKPVYQRMAKKLISAENIRNKFEKTFVEYNPARN